MKKSSANDAGFTLVELIVASAITVTVVASVFALLNPAHGSSKAQPEAADMQQRMRVAVDTLTHDLLMAGAGTYSGTAAGPLNNYFAPVLPYRIGDQNSDPAAGVFFRNDAISVLYVPTTASQATIGESTPPSAQQLVVNTQPNCPASTQDQVCGLFDGMRVLVFDSAGAWDTVTVTGAQAPTVYIQYSGLLSAAYLPGSNVTQVQAHTYYLKTDTRSNTYQLMQYDGYKSDLPVVDNVVKLDFEYFGDPQPPALLPGSSLADGTGPYTTYGPKPPVLGVDNPSDSWPAGENCTFLVQAGRHVQRLVALPPAAGYVSLPPAILTDGPWCPDAAHSNRFDADLLRIRRVRVRMRVQAALASLRGPAGVLFTRGGTATSSQRFVPDQEIGFDVTPRNLNLGR